MDTTLYVKRLDPRAQLPAYQTPGSAAMDLAALVNQPLSVPYALPPLLIPLIGLWSRSPPRPAGFRAAHPAPPPGPGPPAGPSAGQPGPQAGWCRAPGR